MASKSVAWSPPNHFARGCLELQNIFLKSTVYHSSQRINQLQAEREELKSQLQWDRQFKQVAIEYSNAEKEGLA
jgi:hypothetical protein